MLPISGRPLLIQLSGVHNFDHNSAMGPQTPSQSDSIFMCNTEADLVLDALHEERGIMLKVVDTTEAPSAIGPYSQAIAANGFVFVSGQIPIDPQSGEILRGSITEQTNRVLTNLSEILKAAGTSLQNVVKTTVYLKSMNDFDEMNKTYGEYFSLTKPARATVEVGRLPKDVSLEIDAVALISG